MMARKKYPLFLSARWLQRFGLLILAGYLFQSGNDLMAQQDTALLLKPVQVKATRIDLTGVGKHSQHLDSTLIAHRHFDNLGALLGGITPLYVRSYGSGTLATLGVRGGGSSHTQILWNGIPIRNPMLGTVDLALMPVVFIDEAAIHYGGHGAAFGSGAIGGLLALSNTFPTNNNLINLQLGIGSWGRREGSARADYGSDKLRFSTRAYIQSADNDYLYRLDKNTEPRRQVHHRLLQHGLFQQAAWHINDHQILTGRFWYQYTNRQIPPTSTQNFSKAAQQDRSFRSSLQWNVSGKKVAFQLRTAWLDESIHFQDTLIQLFTQNKFITWLSEGELSCKLFAGVNLTGGLYTENATGISDNYGEINQRNQSAAFASVAWIVNDFVWRLQARQELTENIWSPLLIDVAGEWGFVKGLTLNASVSRNYRVPTLNDIYWRPGGNPALQPEEGWTIESGIDAQWKMNDVNLSASFTGYTREIDQWIMWMPPIKDIRAYWSPINIAKVDSRGFETRLRSEMSFQSFSLDIHSGFDLTWSTFETDLPDFGISSGEQLFYVPVENILAGFTFTKDDISVFYDHHWFGRSTGINDELKAASIASGGLALSFKKLKLNGIGYLQADNLWNVPYRIIERRPMPGRTFTAGVKFTFD